jgi:mannonate dehydratase
MALEKSWRWFGFNDPVSLADLKQIGIQGVVTALHHIKNGEVWPVDEIMKVKNAIESYGMRWTVVESLPVSEGIKIKSADRPRLINNYKESLKNLGQCGIDTVCYNFMPVLDWARTDLHYMLPSGGEVMYFDFPTFVAFDAFILKRPNAIDDYPAEIVKKAEEVYKTLSEEDAERLAYNIIVVTQGFINGAVDGSRPDYKAIFLEYINRYKDINATVLRNHLADFLKDVVPTAEEYGVRMCVHPDDPPFSVLGLPRIVSTKEDLQWICNAYDSVSNGITFCSGSLSVRRDNDLVDIVKTLAPRIHFLHLRNNQFSENGCFYESGHLEGSIDMYPLMKALLEEQYRRIAEGRKDTRMPIRPDHGIKLLDDFNKSANPGYPLIGRMKGLAELTGLEMGIEYAMKHK